MKKIQLLTTIMDTIASMIGHVRTYLQKLRDAILSSKTEKGAKTFRTDQVGGYQVLIYQLIMSHSSSPD